MQHVSDIVIGVVGENIACSSCSGENQEGIIDCDGWVDIGLAKAINRDGGGFLAGAAIAIIGRVDEGDGRLLRVFQSQKRAVGIVDEFATGNSSSAYHRLSLR